MNPTFKTVDQTADPDAEEFARLVLFDEPPEIEVYERLESVLAEHKRLTEAQRNLNPGDLMRVPGSGPCSGYALEVTRQARRSTGVLWDTSKGNTLGEATAAVGAVWREHCRLDGRRPPFDEF